ncbi:MAG: aminoacetone oxidase family FAD-binding enzyme [Planctomycetes bacterium]|nr:aminoacetone oxidase family FAD-binding enzyme [Planctomycetota bacterium]
MSSELTSRIVIVGAGAAGLWAAGRAARALAARGETGGVLLIEKTPRTGSKVLASGGTRCNLTTTLGPAEAAKLFGHAGERFLKHAFRALPPQAVRARFAELGVPTEEAPLEKVFPVSGRAVDVRDALEREAREAGARIEFEAGVEFVRRVEGGFEVELAGRRMARCERLVLCAGGKSYPKTGTTGDGYRWIADLGLPLVDPVPALVPLKSPEAWARELTGIALQNAEARLVDAERRVLGKRRRPLVFTHHGVSGPAAMDLSVHVARGRATAQKNKQTPPCYTLELDLAPGIERERLRLLLIEAAGKPGNPVLGRALGELLVAHGAEVLPRRLFARIAAQACIDVDVRANGLDKEQRHNLVESVKSFAVLIDGTLGWDEAEVTSGGLSLDALDPATMQVKAIEGLFVCGELLDLTGPIGGLSFQSAFATAELAARAVVG